MPAIAKPVAEKIANKAAATADRKRFSFGPVWNQAVVDGACVDHEKLIAQAVKLKVAGRTQARAWKFETLRAKVAAAIVAQAE